MKKAYEESSIKSIADAIRRNSDIENKMTVAEMPAYIDSIGNSIGIDIDNSDYDEDGKWIRPTEFEDISSLTGGESEQVCYLSLYKMEETPGQLCFQTTSSGESQIEYGHMVNGDFTPIGEPEVLQSNKVYIKNLPETETTLVAKITPKINTSHITSFKFYRKTASQSGMSIEVPCYQQPVVERAGNLPYLTNVLNSGNTASFCGAYVQRDALKFGQLAVVTSLSGLYQNCTRLREIDIDDIDTSNWKVTNLSYMFYGCENLRKINLNSGDTSKGAVINMSYCFSYCINLRELSISNGDTSNGEVANMSYLFYHSYSISSIDWNKGKTEKGKVNTLYLAFGYCISLRSVNLSDGNTTNGTVTTLQGIFQYCFSLKAIDIGGGNTSGGKVTTVQNMFDGCISLTTIDLNEGDTSGGSVTNLGYMFQRALSLKHLLIDKGDTSNGKVTTATYMFSNNYLLRNIPIEEGNTFNGPLTSVSYICNNCYDLQRADFSKGDSTNFALTNCTGAFSGCYSLQLLNATTLSPKTVTVDSAIFCKAQDTIRTLTEFYPQENIGCDQQYNSFAPNLNKESLMRVLAALPTISTAKKLTLGNARAKLTTTEIAIATNKGWTVA